MLVTAPPSEKGVRRRTKVFIAVAAAIIPVALFAAGTTPRVRRATMIREAVVTNERNNDRVSVISPRVAPTTTELILPANTQAMQDTIVYARTSGYVARRFVDIGDRVKAGQVLAEIESPEVDQRLREANARLAEAQANAVLARRNLDRLRILKDAGVVPKQQFEDQEAVVNTADAGVRVAEATVKGLQTEQGYEHVIAPFAGTITARSIDKGALITAGSGTSVTSLFRIEQEDPLRVFVNVPQSAYPAVKPGQTVAILVDEFPGKSFMGTVARTAGALDVASRTMLTEVDVPNPDSRLLPGLFVRARFSVRDRHPAFVVPATTLVFGALGPRVAVVGTDGTVKFRSVKLGRDLGTEVEVKVGLAGSEKVVDNPGDGLTEGKHVTIATTSHQVEQTEESPRLTSSIDSASTVQH
jgi:RND family efflux transporter MFP subunit